MKVLAHPDPVVLESELLGRVEEAKASDPLARVLVVVPTARLAAHVTRRIAQRLGAGLGVDVLHHRALALTILDGVAGPPLRVASRPLLLALLAQALRRMPENPLARFARERPGAVGALLGTLRDLRDAGLTPRDVRLAARGSREEALSSVFEAYSGALDSRRAAGLADDAELVRAATLAAAEFATRYRAILHHGAYELIGVHLDLVRALDRGCPVALLSPIEPGARVTTYAERFASLHLLSPGEKIERLQDQPGGLLGDRLSMLYDEASEPGPLPGKPVRFRHAQGAVAEFETAARYALAAVAAGTAPDGIAIVARSLEPYAAAVEQVLDEAPLPYTSSVTVPLRREPAVRDLLALLRAAADEFPRERTAEILASPRVRWEALGIDAPPPGDVAEAWSRKAGIVGGLEEWTVSLASWAARPRLHEDATDEELSAEEERARGRATLATRIGRAVGALAARCRAGVPRTWSAHAAAIEGLAREAIRVPNDGRSGQALDALLGLLGEMRALETVLGDRRAVPFPEMVAWLESATDDATLAPRRSDDGGFRVLDAMQVRGLTFDRVLLVGMNSGAFPRVAREDPFLSDDTRERLREATSRPVPVKCRGSEEERLLLALILGSARRALDVSWQRADEGGKAKTASIALREVGRIALGNADVEVVRRAAAEVPAHPERRLDLLARDPGLLSPDEEALLIALRSRGSEEAALMLAGRDGGRLAHGIRMLRSTESFDPADSAYDGRVGGLRVPLDRLSVTALERLGRCPLQYFFRHVLKVRELEEQASAFEIAERDLGERVHALLESLYSRLRDEGFFEPERAGDAVERAEGLLPAEWERAIGDAGARFERRLPVLWGIEQDRWRVALLAFVREDLPRLAGGGFSPRSFEETRRARVTLDGKTAVEIEGRLDRTFERGGKLLIGDYKTSGDLKARASETEMLKGNTLQVPLYAEIAGPGASVELLGVGPEHEPETGARREFRRATFDGFSSPEIAQGFHETVRVLVRLARGGRFPLREGRHCEWCAYRSACRRNDPPTKHREAHAVDTRDFRDVVEKTKSRKPTLERVRAAREEDGEVEP